MSRLHLPDVTLAVADTVAHDLTALAVRDCLDRVDFGDVWIASDRQIMGGIKHIPVNFKGLADADAFRWYGWPQHLTTDHVLIIEWDSWVLDADCWRDEWLRLDYIGALWPWHKHDRVGNGGFSLRSTRLLQTLAAHPMRFPNWVHEDDVLCRQHRVALECGGFEWASDDVARRFSFEREEPHGPTFGFHGAFNWRRVLSPSALKERLDLARANPYIAGKPEWKEVDTWQAR